MSPKNKGTFGKGKTPIEAEDEFVSGALSLGERLRPYASRIAVAVTAVLLVFVVVAIYSWYGDRQAAAATRGFGEAMDVARRPLAGAEAEPPGASQQEEGESGTEGESFDTADARAEATLERLAKLQGEYGSTGVATSSRAVQARLLLDLERYGEARALYEELAAADAPANLRVRAREGVGYSLEGEALAAEDPDARQKGLEAALKAFEAMQPDDNGPMRAHALYHQGRILASLGRREAAIGRFRDALDAGPNMAFRPEIENRLALLDAPAAPEEGEQSGDAAGDGEAAGDGDAAGTASTEDPSELEPSAGGDEQRGAGGASGAAGEGRAAGEGGAPGTGATGSGSPESDAP